MQRLSGRGAICQGVASRMLHSCCKQSASSQRAIERAGLRVAALSAATHAAAVNTALRIRRTSQTLDGHSRMTATLSHSAGR